MYADGIEKYIQFNKWNYKSDVQMSLTLVDMIWMNMKDSDMNHYPNFHFDIQLFITQY